MEVETVEMKAVEELDDDEDEVAEWEDWNAGEGCQEGDEEEESLSTCLFCTKELPTPAEAFRHCASEHSFDFQRLRAEEGMDFYDSIRAINYIRKQVSASRCIACGQTLASRDHLLQHMAAAGHYWLAGTGSTKGEEAEATHRAWQSDEYLTPVMENDSLLFSFEDEEVEDEDADGGVLSSVAESAAQAERRSQVRLAGTGAHAGEAAPSLVIPEEKGLRFAQDLADEILALRLENEELRLALAAAQARSHGHRDAAKVPPTPHPTPVGSPLRVRRNPDAETPAAPSALKAGLGQAGGAGEGKLGRSGLGQPGSGNRGSVEGAPDEDDMPEGEPLEVEEELRTRDDAEEDAEDARLKFAKSWEAVEAEGSWPRRGRGGEKRERSKRKGKVSFGAVAEREARGVDSSYFKSYGAFGIHREMLGDKVRTGAYRAALLENPSLLQGARVLDVGCGTGILSLFAAQAGAAQVVAVDGSAKIASVARQIAEANGFLAGGKREGGGGGERPVITVVQGMVEDLRSNDSSTTTSRRQGDTARGSDSASSNLPGVGIGEDREGAQQGALCAKKESSVAEDSRGSAVLPFAEKSVDLLVSEWMGYCLLFESMLSSVLHARDKWLKPGGAILPDIANMYVAGFGKAGTSLPFWEDVYGFKMEAIGREVTEDLAEVPVVDVIAAQAVITEPCLIQALDLATMAQEDVDFTSSFHLELAVSRNGGKSFPSEGSAVPAAPACLVPGATEAGTHLPGGPWQSAEAAAASSGTKGVEEGSEELQTSAGGGAEEGPVEWCYGVVVWFDVEFSTRFCKEKPVVMSTAPMGPPTHWSQTLLTFKEPIALRQPCTKPVAAESASSSSGLSGGATSGVGHLPPGLQPCRKEAIGTAVEPAVAINGRISIVRGVRHRSIDISLEMSALGREGTVRRWPAQIFDI